MSTWERLTPRRRRWLAVPNDEVLPVQYLDSPVYLRHAMCLTMRINQVLDAQKLSSSLGELCRHLDEGWKILGGRLHSDVRTCTAYDDRKRNSYTMAEREAGQARS